MYSLVEPFLLERFNVYTLSTAAVATRVGMKISETLLKDIPGGVIAANLIAPIIGIGAGKLVERLTWKKNPVNLERLLIKITTCKATNELYKQAQIAVKEAVGNDLTIREESNIPFDACATIDGEICIIPELFEERSLDRVIFELANMTQIRKFKEIDDLASRHLINREEYCLRLELLELETEKICSKVIAAARQEKNVDWVTWDMYRVGSLMPQKLNLLIAKLTGHTGFYQQQWDELYG